MRCIVILVSIAITCGVPRWTNAATLISEDFEGYTTPPGPAFDGNGFANVGTVAGTAISGVSAVLKGSGWNGRTGSQAFLEVANGAPSTLKAFSGTNSVDLNQNGLQWSFSLTLPTNTLTLSTDFGGGDAGVDRDLFWEVAGTANMSGTSPVQSGIGTQNYTTSFSLAAGSYTLSLGSGASGVTTFSGTHIDNISLTSVPEPTSAIYCLLGGMALLGRRRRS